MKILIIGGAGTIGKYLVAQFSKKHEVLIAGRSSGDYLVEINSWESIQSMLHALGKVDSIICAAGEAKWDSFERLSEEDYYIGIRSKMMGQVNLVRLGLAHLNPGGSITLTTGILADDPVVKTSSAAMVNGAIHSFVQACALETPLGLRVNVVSAGMVEDSYAKYRDYFPGHNPISMVKMYKAYERSVEGKVHGQVIRVYQ